MMSETETKIESAETKAINSNSRAINQTIEAFSKENVELPSSIITLKARLEKFKSKFKKDKGPLQIIINTMNRRQIPTFDKETGKAVKKDCLTYNVDFYGKDWLGNDMWIRQHVEGMSLKPTFHTTFKLDTETGEQVPKRELNGQDEEYYIELTDKNRKQVIQDIINNCNGSSIDQIRYYGHFNDSPDGRAFRCDLFTYDQFINSSMEEMERLGRKEGGPQGNAPRFGKDRKPYMA
jgi:hypothetical protein